MAQSVQPFPGAVDAPGSEVSSSSGGGRSSKAETRTPTSAGTAAAHEDVEDGVEDLLVQGMSTPGLAGSPSWSR